MNKKQALRVLNTVDKKKIDIALARVTPKYIDKKSDRSNVAKLWFPKIDRQTQSLVAANGRVIPLNHVLRLILLERNR